MVVGADVSHPAPKSTLPSTSAMVSSWDRAACQYIASVKIQQSRQEIIEHTEEMFDVSASN